MIIEAIELRDKIEKDIENYVRDNKLSLLIVNASNDKASERYINMKKKLCNKNNIDCHIKYFEETCTQEEIMEYIIRNQYKYTGVLIQAPIYDHLNHNELMGCILPNKDVDGLGIVNQGLLYDSKDKGIRTCTALGVLLLMKNKDISIKGKLVVIVGRGKMVADPLYKMLEYEGATVVKIHTGTSKEDAKMLIGTADIIISCAGRDMRDVINPRNATNAKTLIGVGFRYENGKQLQDFDITDEWDADVMLTNNINGTGTATLSALLLNIVECHKLTL